ncbi:MAG: hypothetical protein IID33_12680 [Planctomycetes bacterium]|nr:hypothetical protein [Planctomycetota bacterium]
MNLPALVILANTKKQLSLADCVPKAAAALLANIEGKSDNQILALADLFEQIGFAVAAECLRNQVTGPPTTDEEFAFCKAALIEGMAADINGSPPDTLDGYALALTALAFVLQSHDPESAACLRAVAKAKRVA